MTFIPRTQRVDYSDFESVKQYAENLGPGTLVFKHPMRGVYTVTHKGRTDLYDLTWVVHEVRRKGEPPFVAGKPVSEERQSLEGQDNERVQLKPADYVD